MALQHHTTHLEDQQLARLEKLRRATPPDQKIPPLAEVLRKVVAAGLHVVEGSAAAPVEGA